MLEEGANEYGEEHPSTLVDMQNLSIYLQEQGKHEKAKPLLHKCIAIKVKVQGKETIDTLQSMNRLVNLLVLQGKFDKADEMSQENSRYLNESAR